MFRAREEDFSKRNKTRLELWEEHLKDPLAAQDVRSDVTVVGRGPHPPRNGMSLGVTGRTASSSFEKSVDAPEGAGSVWAKHPS